MADTLILRTGLCAACLLPVAAATAQETVFGIEQGLEYGRNTSLSVPAEGDRLSAVTRLSYELTTATRTQELSFGADAVFRIENFDDETTSEFESPTVTLAYSREGANGSFDIAARYATRDIDTLPLISDFIGDDGVLDLPEDFADLTGSGQRTDYAATSTLVVGSAAPLRFQLDLGVSGTTYDDVTDPDLEDSETANIGLTTGLRFSDVFTGRVGLRYAVTQEDDATDTRREVTSLSIGAIYEISPRATLDASIGTERTVTEETTGDDETSGLTGRLAFGYDMPNGDVQVVLDASRDVEGDRITTFTIGRSIELPAGELSASLGVTNLENDDVSLIGSIDWTRELPTSQVLFRLNRSVSVDSDADTRRRTLAGAYYDYQVNRLSALNLGLTYILDEESDASNRVERADLIAGYSYALTADWDLRTGLGFSVRDEDTVGRAEATVVTISIGREFRARR